MRFLILLMGFIFMNAGFAMDFTFTSNSFTNGSTIPVKYTCDGSDTSPAFSWSNPPEKTQSFALICKDPDAPAGTWYHWVVYNIPSSAEIIAENQMPAGSIMGKNSWGHARYNGPCPPKGLPHHYIFTLYALDTKLTLAAADGPAVENAMTGHVLQSIELTGLYGR